VSLHHTSGKSDIRDPQIPFLDQRGIRDVDLAKGLLGRAREINPYDTDVRSKPLRQDHYIHGSPPPQLAMASTESRSGIAPGGRVYQARKHAGKLHLKPAGNPRKTTPAAGKPNRGEDRGVEPWVLAPGLCEVSIQSLIINPNPKHSPNPKHEPNPNLNLRQQWVSWRWGTSSVRGV